MSSSAFDILPNAPKQKERLSAFVVLMANAKSQQRRQQHKQCHPNKHHPDVLLMPNACKRKRKRKTIQQSQMLDTQSLPQEPDNTKNPNSVHIHEARIDNVPPNETANARLVGVHGGLAVKKLNSMRIEGIHNMRIERIHNGKEAFDSALVLKEAKVTISPVESEGELKDAVNFDPSKAAYWVKGESVPFMFVARTLDAISKENSRIVITNIACNMLRTVMETSPQDLVALVCLLSGRIAPAHEGLELGIGDVSVIKALAEACGAKEGHVTKLYKELGDLGLVAKACRTSQTLLRKPEALTVTKVFDTLQIIAKESGKYSQEKKKNHIKGLIVAGTGCEPQYLIRLLQADLRIGLSEKTLLTALGHAAVYYAQEPFLLLNNVNSSLQEAAKIVKKAYSVIPDYEKIIHALLAHGVWDLPKTCTFSVGVPVEPMLATAARGVAEIFDKFQGTEFTCEYKYDGERAQIHFLENGSVEIYSRHAERNTGKYPDVVEAISRLKESSVTSFVLDCELVAYDREKKSILTFQAVSSRAHTAALQEIKVAVCIYAFDILYLNGQTLMQEQLVVRRQHLYKSFKEEPGFFQFVTAIASNDPEVIHNFLEAAVDARCEGLVIKALKKEATYEPTKRSRKWIKLKKDYMDSIGDSLDLVPIAAFYGYGKRKGVYGAFLLACYDSEEEEFQSICKIGTGLSKAMLEELFARFQPRVIPKPKSYYRCPDSISPDVWFEPSEGISLRFPRLIRVREDKKPELATSSEMVAVMYNAQNHA